MTRTTGSFPSCQPLWMCAPSARWRTSSSRCCLCPEDPSTDKVRLFTLALYYLYSNSFYPSWNIQAITFEPVAIHFYCYITYLYCTSKKVYFCCNSLIIHSFIWMLSLLWNLNKLKCEQQVAGSLREDWTSTVRPQTSLRRSRFWSSPMERSPRMCKLEAPFL